MPNPDPLDILRQRLAGTSAGRTTRKSGRISNDPITPDTEFAYEQQTFFDPQTNKFMTTEAGSHYLLSCGCRASSPNQVLGICPICARSLRVRLRKELRLICCRHEMCLRCERKRQRRMHGGGFWRTALAILIWPLCDVTHDDDK